MIINHLTPDRNLALPIAYEEAPTSGCRINDTAVCIIKCLGLLFTAAGTACMISSILVPTIALLVVGVASLVFGFICSTKQVAVPAMAFGKQAWIDHIGDPGEIPPLPRDIHEILASDCPFWSGIIANTHMLVLIPKTVVRSIDGVPKTVPLTLKTLNEMAKCSKNGKGVGFAHIDEKILKECGDSPIQKSHWVLMTKDIVDGSKGMDYAKQAQLVEEVGYEVPSCLEAVACILLEYLRSETYLFKKDPYTLTRCKDMLEDRHFIVGGFSETGVNVLDGSLDFKEGVAGIRKL